MNQPPAGGRTFADYELFERLGKGGMGEVFRARARGSHQDVALKLAPPDAPLDERGRARFLREGKIAASLDHPGILSIHGAGVVEGRPYLVYPLIQNVRTLDAVLPERSLSERVGLLRDVARALGHAHAQGVVHRDVKPENVLIAGEQPLVADFGLATAQGLERLTQTGAMLGTPLYMAPELVVTQRDSSRPENDVYSLGVMLFEALTDSHPYADQGWEAFARPELRRVPNAAEVAGVPASLARIVERALEIKPEDRYPDGDRLADALDGWLLGTAESDVRRPALLAGAALTVLGLGGVGLLLWQSSPEQTEPVETIAPSVAAVSPSPTIDSATRVERSQAISAARDLLRSRPLPIAELTRVLSELELSRAADRGGPVSRALADETILALKDRELSWDASAGGLIGALARSGCRPADRRQGELLADASLWAAESLLDPFSRDDLRELLRALVALDVDIEHEHMKVLFAHADESPEFRTASDGVGRYLLLRLSVRGQHAASETARRALRNLVQEGFGPVTSARGLIESHRPVRFATTALPPEVLADLRRAKELDPDSAWVRLRLGHGLLLGGVLDEGNAELEAARALWRAHYRHRLAMYYLELDFTFECVVSLLASDQLERAQGALDELVESGVSASGHEDLAKIRQRIEDYRAEHGSGG